MPLVLAVRTLRGCCCRCRRHRVLVAIVALAALWADATASQSATSPSNCNARLAVLTSTNLNALFRTTHQLQGHPCPPLPHPRPTPPPPLIPVFASWSAAWVINGDYSHFLLHYVGVCKSASRLPALRTARHALGTQRDVSLERYCHRNKQSRKALTRLDRHILNLIGISSIMNCNDSG